MANVTQRDPSRAAGLAGQSRLPADDTPRDHGAAKAPSELEALRAENAELRRRVEELEQLFQSPEILEELFADRKREYESMIEEKSEVIRALHLKIQEFQETAAAAVAPPADAAETAARAADAANAEDVLELQRQLDEERKQLKEDEQMLMKQMRDMELTMARDRAEMARQRAELQRLHNDLNRELEQSSRDSGLRERLLALARKGQEAAKAKTPAKPTDAKSTAAPAADAKKTNSGFFRRIFGG